MPAFFLEFFLILILILINGVLAMAEIAVVSARKARLQQRVDEGDLRAQTALELANNPADFLSTIQIGITLVGILAGAFGGATVAMTIAGWLNEIAWIAPYSGVIAFGLVVIAITYLSLILGELAPKRLALNDPEGIAALVAGPLYRLSKMAAPLVRLLSYSAGLVLRLFGVRPSTAPPVTEEEIKVLIKQGTLAGVFEAAEQDMVAGVFRLGERRVGTLITPRTEIVWLDVEDSPELNRGKIIESVHTRFPVAKDGLDNLLGIANAKDLLAHCLSGEPLDLQAGLQPPLYVPESTPALKVLELFKETGQQMVLVIDEYGGLEGLVTLTDILEAIVGDITVLGGTGEPEIVQREDGSWLLDGMLPMDEFRDLFAIATLPDEDKGYYQTLGGFIMAYLGRIPKETDQFEWSGWRFEVMDMDGMRVDKILVVPLTLPPEEQAETRGGN
jgi:putative hemolysin